MKPPGLATLLLALVPCTASTDARMEIGGGNVVLDAGKIASTRIWVNADYQACIAKKLPCDCVDIQEPHLLYWSPEDEVVEVYGRETDAYYLKSTGPFKFIAYNSKNSEEPSFLMHMADGRIRLAGEHSTATPFLPLDSLAIMKEHDDKLGRYNYLVIKRRAKQSGVEFSASTHLDTSQCVFHCNWEIGFLNLLSQRGSCEHNMIVVKEHAETVFYRELNGCEGKSVPFVVDTLRAFQFKNNP